jgi:hypothetical protein
MITIHNYFEQVKNVDFSALPAPLQKGNDYVRRVTVTGSNTAAYDINPSIKKAIDLYFKTLDKFLLTAKASEKPSKLKKETTVQIPKEQANKITAIKKKEVKNVPVISRKISVRPSPPKNEADIRWVEKVPEELRFMKRYINLDGKTKTYDQLLSFINSLQRAILEKRIRKTSPYAKQIGYMQKKLIEAYNGRKTESTTVRIVPATLKEFSSLFSQEKVLQSVQLIKRFISIHGRTGVKEKAQKLYASITKAVKNGKVEKGDRYAAKLNEIWRTLKDFIEDGNQPRLAMDSEELNGLMGLLKDCNCGGLDGIDVTEEKEEEVEKTEEPKETSNNHVMSSMDFANLKFNTIGLTGKWLELMGDPAPGFTAMVFGKPKSGKSYLCVDFAGYLSRMLGKVLYVAREEGLDATLQKKLNETNVKNPNLFISDYLPEDLSGYDFIFLDSVNKLGLSSTDLDKLRKDNHGKSFVFVFQTTKDGHFKGRNEFQHDVDIVIEVTEHGKATQYGRYNQGGEMNIFDSNSQTT